MSEYTLVLLPEGLRQFDRGKIATVLKERDLLFDITGTSHVLLRPSVPWVKDRGWLNFFNGWTIHSEPPGQASWQKSGANSAVCRVELRLAGLTPRSTYVVAIDVFGVSGPNVAYRIGATGASEVLVNVQTGDQALLVPIKANTDVARVTVEPHNLDFWMLYQVEVFKTKK